ncbi:MAG: hypothetical protein L0154_09875 [Chloroflexi bacterium]|nr:hypothetical protein [Chloroflexota bacterium]
MASQSMNAAAERFASQGIGSIFLYTHEAHPAEHYPAHRSMRQKFQQARALRDILGVTRPILVDTLDGGCHRHYGGFPNMTWIFSRAGTIVYKADWTATDSVVRMVEYLLEVQEQRKNRERLAPFRVERLDFRDVDRAAFYDGLRRNGPQAVADFARTFPDTAQYAKKE